MAARQADVLLSDGATVHIRSITPDDADRIVALHSRFSDRTRYLRYFSPYPRIPARDLERFVTVDHRDREALVAEVDDQLIAVGRYERLGPDASDAEVAFVVEDAHQGRGIGSVLLEHLAAAAATVGITRFVAEVLPENGAMLRVFADAGYQIRRQYADGVVHVEFGLAPTERSRDVQESREHRSEARSIARLLAPRAVAVYGVSRTGKGAGAAMLRHIRGGGFAGPVVVVHPDAPAVAGLPAVPSIVDADVSVDIAVVAVPPDQVLSVVEDAAAGGVHGLVVVSAAPRELLRAVRGHGMRLVGPNCLGVANTAVALNATLAPRLPRPGRVGLFSQSGTFGIALLAEAERRRIGLSSFTAVGSRADVSGNDLLQYWQDDDDTGTVLMYLETFGNPRKFTRLARRIGRVKPVVAVASPVRVPGVNADAPGPDAASVAALFAQSGVIRVDTVPELFDVAVLLDRQPLPAGDRVAVVTNAVALGALAADGLARTGLSIADGYPADVGPQADAVQFASAVSDAVGDPGVDSVLAVCAPPLPPGGEDGFAPALDVLAAGSAKPILASFLAGEAPAVVPSYPWVEEAVRALGRVAGYARWRRTPPGDVPELSGVDPAAAPKAPIVEDLLGAYGIPVVPSTVVTSEEGAVAAAQAYGRPVAVKATGSGLRHRYDLGAVRLDLASPEAVRYAYREVSQRFGPEVFVQPMVAPGVACAVQVVDDPAFGPVVGFGLGGAVGDLLGDWAWRAAPLTSEEAAALVRAPGAAPLLSGYRAATPVDADALAGLLIRVGALADGQPRLRRLSLNPVLARPDGYSVLHASVEYGQSSARPDTGPRALPQR